MSGRNVWSRSNEIEVWPLDPYFGAAGDGVNDDTTPIQNAIDYAQASGRLKRVILGPGVFKISSTLTLAGANKGIALIGTEFSSMQQGSAGPSTVLRWTGGADAIITVTNTFNHYIGFALHNFGSATHGIKVTNGGRDFFFMLSFAQPAGSSVFSTAALELNGFDYTNIDRCEFEQSPALRLRGSADTTLDIGRCVFDISSGSNPMFDVDANIDIVNIHSNTFNFQTAVRTVWDNSGTSSNVTKLNFIGNEFDGNAIGSQCNIALCKNVAFMSFVDNLITGFGSSSTSPIQLTNSRLYIANNRAMSIGDPIAETLDSTSYVYVGPNFLTANNTEGPLDNASQSGNLIPVTPASNAARLHGELISPLAPATFVVTASNSDAFEVQIAVPTDSDAGRMTVGQVFTVMIVNSSGGTMGAVTFNASQFTINNAFGEPANGASRAIVFEFNGTKAVEITRFSPDAPTTTTDNAIVRWDGTAGSAIQNSGVTIDDSDNLSVPSTISKTSTNGQQTQILHATTLLSALSGATATATNLIPAGSLVLGVTTRVTTLITGATSFEIGDGTDVDRWGTAVAVAAGTTTDIANFTIASPVNYTAANNVVLTANGSNFTGGAVRLTVHYIDLVAATS